MGLDTWFEWRSVGSRDASYTGNSRPPKETQVNQNCGIKTRSELFSSGATSIQETWRDMPWTDQNVEARFIELLPTSKSSLPETHCCQRETPQNSLGSDHNNWLPVPPVFKTLCLWAGAAGPPPCSWVAECKRHHRILWTTTIFVKHVKCPRPEMRRTTRRSNGHELILFTNPSAWAGYDTRSIF